jgi:D-sedoheptulose 7-phosphate isomerase
MDRDYTAGIDAYFSTLKSTLDRMSREEISGFMNVLVEALESGRTIFIMGNGGSGATASHYASDFNKGLSLGKARRFRFICLNDNLPTLTAYANDSGYEKVFVEPLRNFLEKGDVVIGLSGSGNSPNVLAAIEYANSRGAVTVGLTGYDGGRLKTLVRHGVHVPLDNMQVAEDIHMILDHLIYAVLKPTLPEER